MSIKMLSLSNREAEIAGHLALGKTEKEVAGELCVSVDTVHTHKRVYTGSWEPGVLQMLPG